MQENFEYCYHCITGIVTATFGAISQFTEEVRANSEDDDTMISLEQKEKERSYESIEYHKPHTEVYEEFLKRKRLSRLIKSHSSLASTVLAQIVPSRVNFGNNASSSSADGIVPGRDPNQLVLQFQQQNSQPTNTNSSSSNNNTTNESQNQRERRNSAASSTESNNNNNNNIPTTSVFDDSDTDNTKNSSSKKRLASSSFSAASPPASIVVANSNVNTFPQSNDVGSSEALNSSEIEEDPEDSHHHKNLRKIIDIDEVGNALLSDARNKTVGERLAASMEDRPLMIKFITHIILALVVGAFVAVVSNATSFLEEWRISAVESVVMEVRGRGKSYFLVAMFEGLLTWLFSALLLVGVGTAVVVFIEPGAGGSGLPQVMAYLNGVLVRGVFGLKGFVIKTISVIGAVAGGLPCGAEAPFVLLGAAIGAGISSGRSRALGIQTSLLQGLRNSKDRRDFVTAGAACGVAAAFGSPIGGMLFVMEEASVVWDLMTSTQIFLGSMTAFTAMAILGSILSEQRHGWVSHDVSVMFQVQYAGTIPLNITAVVPAIILGTICGLLTVVFTKVNLYLTKFRAKKIDHNTGFRFLEPIVVVLIYATISFVLPLVLPCHDLVSHDESASKLNGTQIDTAAAWFTENETVLTTFMCSNPQEEYSPLGTLSMGLGKRSIRRLLSRRTIQEFPLYVLLIYFVTYFSFGAYINGSAIASGLLIPFIVMGSTVGRTFGLLLIELFAKSVVDPTTGALRSAYFLEDSWMDPGVYALIGAAAFIGGATRMTISIPVIMVELSGELRFLLPIMVAIATARVVADSLCVPLYHQLLHLVCVPYLPYTPNGVNMELFTVKHLVSKQQKITYLPLKPTLQQVLDVLRETNHHMFPVLEVFDDHNNNSNNNNIINCPQTKNKSHNSEHPNSPLSGVFQNNNNSSANTGTATTAAVAASASPRSTRRTGPGGLPLNHRLRGSVSREDLQVMLALPDFDIGPQAIVRYNPNKPYHQLRYEDWVEHENSMFFLISTVEWSKMWNSYVPHITEERGNQIVDLRLILNRSPWTAVASQSLAEAFYNVRTMSIRHLIVVEDKKVIGMITRKDLLPYRLRQLQAKLDNNLLVGAGLESWITAEGGDLEEELSHRPTSTKSSATKIHNNHHLHAYLEKPKSGDNNNNIHGDDDDHDDNNNNSNSVETQYHRQQQNEAKINNAEVAVVSSNQSSQSLPPPPPAQHRGRTLSEEMFGNFSSSSQQ